ncbi:MAG: hypothetical protein A3F14_04190 [Gammaproteobacteria bacterium RIFCSPHIGHO2_12_FULL_43_28]|nr:MAG: hypothetical protein A3F14_04190 [Gammaproteobacteria bacterium RIFCSPHIGHO2_12_FULL_43_28]
MKTFLKALSLLLFLLLPLPSQAWNALGHMVVATIAYQHLQPTVRDKIDQFTPGFEAEYPQIKSFSQLAPWPDQLHLQRIETYSHWHYIDTPFSDDGTPLTNTIDTDNAVWAVNTIRQVIKNQHANPYERSRFLAFFIHIIGDLHQPLHTVSRLSKQHPDGDRGGNLYYIQYQNERVRLHHAWDGGLGLFEHDSSTKNAENIAATITSHYPESFFGARASDINPTHWVDEGVENAKQYVYHTPEEEPISPTYLDSGNRVIEQETALAGYRLAALLNQLLA